MRIALLATALAATTALATPAFAQDSEPTFTGPRAEAVVGWDHVTDDSTYGAKKDGVVYGGALGYDYQTGNLVLGAEGEVTGATTKEAASDVLITGDTLGVRAGRDLYAGGRVGFVVGDRALIYAKGGYTNARISEHYTAPGTPGINVSDHDNLDGWRIGAGAEVKLGGKVYAKAEYRYSDYDSSNLGIDLKRHQVVGGVGIRF